MEELLKLFSTLNTTQNSQGMDFSTLLPLFSKFMENTQKKDVDIKPTPELSTVLHELIKREL